MKKLLKLLLRGTFLDALYKRHIAPRRLKKAFWNWTREDDQRYQFYKEFIGSGDLVFDVGANVGNRTKIFLKLGSTVVSVEPQDACADYLKIVLKDVDKSILVRKALGSKKGEAEMIVSSAHVLSTLSPAWVESTQKSGRFAEIEWNQRQKVEIDTLDSLVEIYGQPKFIKIDVEGFELEVLNGLSKPAYITSIEFINESVEMAIGCVDRMCSLSEVDFQISLGESMAFEFEDWVAVGFIKAYLRDLPSNSFGDIYMRCREV